MPQRITRGLLEEYKMATATHKITVEYYVSEYNLTIDDVRKKETVKLRELFGDALELVCVEIV